MNLIELKIKGFNSFLEEQSIDFKKLTSNGIFGIFGKTGSGKSSIIDAITFALYGSVARYETGEKRAFINSNTNIASVVLEFSISSDKVIFYKVSREIKRRESGTLVHNARLIKIIENNIEVIAENSREVNLQIVKIIGLDYKDFIRSVVLPQGKFSEFLMLKNMERRNMLERIFNLEKYGSLLNNTINEKRKEQIKIVEGINNKLEIFGDISEKNISELEKSLEEKKKSLEKSRNDLSEKNILFEKYKIFIELKNEFDYYSSLNDKLEEKKDDINIKIKMLEKRKEAEKLYPLLLDFNKSSREYNDSVSKFDKLKIDFEAAEKNFIEIKNNFDMFMLKKEKEYPDILKKEAELKQGIKIQKYIDTLEKERNELLKEYKKNKKDLLKKNNDLNLETNIKEEADNNILNIEKKKNTITFSPEYRNNIEKAYNIEKKCIELENNYNIETASKNELISNIEKEENNITSIENNIAKLKNKIDTLKNERYTIGEKCIYDFSYIVETQKSCEEEKNIFLSKKEKYDKYNLISNDLEKAINDKHEYEKTADNLLNSEKEKNNTILKLDEKIKLLENEEFILKLALKLKENTPCPVCGSVSHPSPAQKISDGVLEELIKQKDYLKKEVSKITDEKNEVASKIAVLTSEIKKYQKEINKIEDNIKNFNVEEEQNILEQKLSDFEKAKKEFENWNENKQKLDKEENVLNSELNELNINSAKIKSELKKDKEILKKSENTINKISEEKSKHKNKLNKLKEQFNIDCFEKEYLKLIDFAKQKSILENEEKLNRDISAEKQKNIEKIKIEITETEKNIEKIKTSGKEKKAAITENRKLLSDICIERELEEFIDEISEKKNYFEKKENYLKKELAKSENKKDSISEEKINAEKEYASLEKIKSNNFERLNNAILESRFQYIEDIEKFYITKEKIEEVEKEINDYNDYRKDVSANLKNISTKIKKNDISCDDEDFKKLRLEIELLNNDIEKTISEIGMLENKISETKVNLIKVNELKKEQNIQTHTLDLISDLSNTMKGNRFIEFISKRQLWYITLEASEKLRKITKGRYSIELDNQVIDGEEDFKIDSANFIIRDDFNGGTRRTPKSLSGGEIFLTSLSLALALSGKIQLKNNAPLETFFLDEGFGTLDSDFLDIVMDSLEQLSFEKINIGIITHIEEIKNRVQSKIIVEPSDGISGSKIKIDY